ncbi:MAG: ribbon-helix-helix protein, CopG family [Candidatus Marinimicrobia bacterium]|nr:ribbon-helix-helix protein, CopG family [Candidatus Neomarinimicrobiota bacterium]
MATVKTAISIPASLFEELEVAAKEMQLSRSEVFRRAVERFLRDRESQRMMEKLKEVYSEPPDEEEREYLKKMKALYSKSLEQEEW